MSMSGQPVTKLPASKALQADYERMRGVHLRKLFAADPQRGKNMTAEGAGVYLDYSRNRITGETLRLLISLAEAAGLRARIDAILRGETISISENRAVLHGALRAPRGACRFFRTSPQRYVETTNQQAGPERHQRRDRRLGFRRMR
jgi:glucose-6-phosphate isomerase